MRFASLLSVGFITAIVRNWQIAPLCSEGVKLYLICKDFICKMAESTFFTDHPEINIMTEVIIITAASNSNVS